MDRINKSFFFGLLGRSQPIIAWISAQSVCRKFRTVSVTQKIFNTMIRLNCYFIYLVRMIHVEGNTKNNPIFGFLVFTSDYGSIRYLLQGSVRGR